MCVRVFVCVKEIESEGDQEREKEPLTFLSLARSRFTVIIFHFFFFFSHDIFLQGMFAFDIIDHIGGGPMGLVTPVWLEKV